MIKNIKEKTEKKGLFQVRRVKVDLRGPEDRFEEAEIGLNSVLIELQQNDSIEIIDVIDASTDKTTHVFLIKYMDFGLNN